MSLVFAAAIPNTPEFTQELLPDFDAKNSATVQALREIEGECYFMKPDTVIVLTEHDSAIPELISANIDSTLESAWYSSMEQPSPLNHTFHTDIGFVTRVKEVADISDENIPFTIHAERTLSAELSAPLAFILQHLTAAQVITISTAAGLSLQEHYQFGQFLHHEIQQTNKRIAVFATGRLGSTSDSHAQTLDTVLQTAIREQDPNKMLKMNADVIEQSATDMMRPLATVLGVIDKTNTRCEMLSYEKRHGHGQAVINFILQ